MTILASSAEYIAEYDCGVLFIHRKSDDRHIALEGRRIAGNFRDCLATHSPERVIQTFIRMAGPKVAWREPLYKPDTLALLES